MLSSLESLAKGWLGLPSVEYRPDTVRGLVTTRTLDVLMKHVDVINAGDQLEMGDKLRELFWNGGHAASDELVIRPNIYDPDEYYRLETQELRDVLRIGFVAEVSVQRDSVIQPDKGVGRVTRVHTVLDRPPVYGLPLWPVDEAEDSGLPVLGGRMGVITTATGSALQAGDPAIIKAGKNTGKTWTLLDFVRCIRPGFTVVVSLIGERAREKNFFERIRLGRPGAEYSPNVFIAPGGRSKKDQILLFENVLQQAMRLAEQGDQVVLCIDSATMLVEALTAAKTPEGIGIRSGGHNPLSLDYLAMLMSIAKKPPGYQGSITILITALDRRNDYDLAIINQLGAGGSTVEYELDYAKREAEKFPPINFGIKETMRGGEKIKDTRTISRTQSVWCPPWIMQNAAQLRQLLNTDEPNTERGLAAYDHFLTSVDKALKKFPLHEEDLDIAAKMYGYIFKRMGIAHGQIVSGLQYDDDEAAPAPAQPASSKKPQQFAQAKAQGGQRHPWKPQKPAA